MQNDAQTYVRFFESQIINTRSLDCLQCAVTVLFISIEKVFVVRLLC